MGGSVGVSKPPQAWTKIARSLSLMYSSIWSSGSHIALEAHTVINLARMTSGERPQSTMVALVLTPEGTAHWAHVGNSRLYRFSGPNPAFRTVDHSYREKLIAVAQGTVNRISENGEHEHAG